MTKKMTRITRSFEFDAAHRVLGHQGKCANLHGHRYKVLLSLQCKALDELDMVVDFSVVKERVGSWIDEALDHNTILHRDDPLAKVLVNDLSLRKDILPTKTLFLMSINPTAESLALMIYQESTRLLLDLSPTVIVESVEVFETPNCSATYPS